VRVYSDEMSTASSPTTEPRAETDGGPGPSLYPREDPRTPAGGSAWPSGGQWRHHVPGDMPSNPDTTKTNVVVTKDLTLQVGRFPLDDAQWSSQNREVILFFRSALPSPYHHQTTN
jgi:hypothetical protein